MTRPFGIPGLMTSSSKIPSGLVIPSRPSLTLPTFGPAILV